jgi:O-acetyl-ADP-ribose deacetylase (regulator of RNase III)
MRLFLRDINTHLCDAWRVAFAGASDVEIEPGDIFRSPVDAVVSPANSFGWMTGGIDAHYVRVLGEEMHMDVRQQISDLQPFGELLVGSAIVVPVQDSTCTNFVISAPTMRLPGPTTQLACFLSTRAAIYTALAMSESIKTVAMPGMGTLTGQVPPAMAAQAMRQGYDDAYAAWEGH